MAPAEIVIFIKRYVWPWRFVLMQVVIIGDQKGTTVVADNQLSALSMLIVR